MDPALTLRAVCKTFSSKTVVDRLDLNVPRGALYGVIGPNGAGKTTCIRMVMSILFPDSGTLSVLGYPTALAAKDRIGYLPEERGVYRKMRVSAFLTYIGQLKGLSASVAAERASTLLTRVGLPDAGLKRCEELSKGMLQRVQLAAAIVHEPDLLILDEPFSGLDPVSMRILRDVVLAEHRRGATILLSTHAMAQAEELCQHVVMLHQGRKVLDEPMAGLRRQYDPRTIILEPREFDADIRALRNLSDIQAIEAVNGHYRIRLRERADAADCIPRITAAVPTTRVELARVTLEDMFVRIVSEGSSSHDVASVRASLSIDQETPA